MNNQNNNGNRFFTDIPNDTNMNNGNNFDPITGQPVNNMRLHYMLCILCPKKTVFCVGKYRAL